MSYYGYENRAEVSVLVGKILTKVENRGNDELHFYTEDGEHYALYHQQDCCESVYIESIVGDLNDLVGSRINVAEEVSSEGMNGPADEDYSPESYTWTFYKFATVKGYVDVRFYGTSNGYYSEGVDFTLIPN